MTLKEIQPLNIQTISSGRLFFNIHQALGADPGERYMVDAQALPEEHFRLTRLVLKHLLGEDIGFSNASIATPRAPQGQKLFLIYQSEKARKLYADAMAISVSEVTPWRVHQFFSRLAWLDESTVSSEAGRAQLNDYLYGLRPYRGEDVVLDLKDYPELGGLLTAVPQDLRLWMVQFRRGARLMPVGEWIAHSSGRVLYDGLSAARDEKARAPLSVIHDAISSLLPPDEYRDRPLSVVLDQRLSELATWWQLEFYLKATSDSDPPCAGLQIDYLTPTPLASRAEFYRKAVAYAVNPHDEAWLSQAIAKAKDAPGMRALSLAIELRFKHADLTFESAIALATVLLGPALTSSPEVSESLPTSRVLDVHVPRLDTWSAVRNADELFRELGIGLLCRPGTDALRWRPAHAWYALIQTARFKSMSTSLLSRMQWYGALSNQQASPRITQALVGRAIVDDFLGATGAFAEPLAKTLRGAWVCGYSHVQLCKKLRDDIKARLPGVSSSTLDMLYYLLMREAMPELLVEGVPDHLQYGRSLQSVALIQGVALLESMRPGHSLAPQYDEVIGISAQLTGSTDAHVHALWAKTLVIPALRYAIAHGAIEGGIDDLDRASPAQVRQALNHLKTQQQLHASELNDLLSIKPPDRKRLAEHMLAEANVDQRLWETAIKVHGWPILQEHGFTISDSYSIDRLLAVGRPQATIVELVMMGEAYIEGKLSIPQAYASAFDAFRQALIRAETRVMRRLLTEMQVADRTALLNSTCEVSRVAFADEEGVHGLFIRCQPGDHRADFHEHKVAEEVFHELIPAGGVIRKVEQRFQYKVQLDTGFSGNIVETVEKRQRNAEKLAQAPITPLLPLDSDAYLKGTASRSSVTYHQPRQGTLIPASRLIYLPDGSEQARLDAFVQVAAGHLFARFLERSRAEHEHATQWEQLWAKEREYADVAARLVIPFYGCITDLAHDNHSAEVIVGCVVEVAFALIPAGQFAGSTARIVLKAGEMSVSSIFSLTGKAVARLIVGLAEQSAVFVVRDAGRLAFKVGKLGWAKLLEQVPSLKRIFASRGALERGLYFDKGMYRIADSAEHPWRAKATSLGKRATVDGRSDVIVRNVGTAHEPDFRLLDPESDAVFGKRLTPVSKSGPLAFSSLSASDGIAPGQYPTILPVLKLDGFTELRVARGCSVRVIERDAGVFDILVDGEVYRLEASAPDVAMRKLSASKLSGGAYGLEEVEDACRARRNLESVPCATGVKLATPTPDPLVPESTSPKRTGKYPSYAMDAREFTLDRLTTGVGETSQSLDVFVYEGKFCKWAEQPEATPSTSAQAPAGKAVVALSQEERELFALPEIPVYLPQLDGLLSDAGRLGVPPNYSSEDTVFVYEFSPVIEFGAIAHGVSDTRMLRGVRLQIGSNDWIFVEPDTGVFYKTRAPEGGRTRLTFSRVTSGHEINEFIRVSEQYRLVRERPNLETDRGNIARLLFDLLDESERDAWKVSWGHQISSYDDYVRWCVANKEDNALLEYASNILAGEDVQKKFVELTKQSIPDFKKIAERSAPEKQHIMEVLNRLLPVAGSKNKWEALNMQSIVTPKAVKAILSQIKGANLSFAQVCTESGERVVYYALSGGEKARGLKLRVDSGETTEQILDGIIFRDARARMAGREPDPWFTSLPVVRDAARTVIRDFSRDLDAERLIATVLKEDMAATRLTHIRFFTVLDTCRSCGGFVLPRLKLDFPDALFSVTYLKNYTFS
ncbi:deaminase domain-containing protein [Pseudomonas lijiangensis]|uniref:deaminase domain-containing protein n=1 Tax=Pseudomonas lijiangensis TaxID=2995658 RepID=UPI0031B9C8DD